MCGLAVIYNYGRKTRRLDRQELTRMCEHMRSRGPDGHGTWFSSDNTVAIGHRRLSIIDLSEQASQPMISQDDDLVIAFNGEIYNYQSLRKALEAKGCRFRSTSDTEVLLHLYQEKGEAMVDDLRGMFAFVLWDANRRTMLLVRDPYGIKPLYYADDGKTLRIASQVKTLIAGGGVSQTKDPAGMAGFFLLGSVPEPYTTYLQIRSVPAGSMLRVNNFGVSLPKQYFSIARVWESADDRSAKKVSIAEKVREALLDTVRNHMVADVPVGAFLSAGIDSGVLVALMSELRKANNQPIRTITLAFEEFRGQLADEAPLAKKMADKYLTKHSVRYVTVREFNNDLPKILEAMDQPSIDGLNTWFIAKAAKEQGLKVAVSGLGGDELFGGYPSFVDIPRCVKLLSIPSRIPALGDCWKSVFWAIGSKRTNLSPKTGGLVKYGGTYPGAWFLRRGLFMPWELPSLMGKDLANEGVRKLNLQKYIAAVLQPCPKNAFGKVAVLETTLYMRNQLLRDADWAGMAHSLEIRIPLADIVLLQRLAPLLSKIGKNTKALLGQSPLDALPKDIMARPKTGFATPIQKWLMQTNIAKSGGFHLKEKRLHGSRLWGQIVAHHHLF
jgi:asparagine synthase (glutamine-hydrolysing)